MVVLPSWWGAFSRKDPTKVDDLRVCFKIFGKNVASKIADKCLIQLACNECFKTIINLCRSFDNDEEKNRHVEKLV